MKKMDPSDDLYDRGALHTVEQLARAIEKKEISGESGG
jgi:hypothetical protein